MGLRPAEAIGRWIVGPPLDEILARAIGSREPDVLSRARQLFKETYDGGACRLALAYEGVDAMLHDVLAGGGRLVLATNKRLQPTAMILECRGWKDLFSAVETVDSRAGVARGKPEILADILREAANRSGSFYLGDTPADASAAVQVGIPFLYAAWGGGVDRVEGAAVHAQHPAAVAQIVFSGGGRSPVPDGEQP
jgi:phosphoglycolate phosphatase